MMKKILKRVLIGVLILLFLFVALIVGGFQWKANRYFVHVNKKHGIFKNRQRRNFVPFVHFYIKSKLFPDQYKVYWHNTRLPYCELGLKKYWFGHTYAFYYMYTYYTEDEIKQSDCYVAPPSS